MHGGQGLSSQKAGRSRFQPALFHTPHWRVLSLLKVLPAKAHCGIALSSQKMHTQLGALIF
eukprot:scaffold1916_cov123-Isochrysis_galbana.AAC.7